MKTDLAAKPRGAANDHPRDIVASGITWHYPIRDEKGGSACMVSDDTVGGEIGLALSVSVPGQLLRFLDLMAKEGSVR